MQKTIDSIYNEFVEIEESIQALAITTGILKEHFDRDTEKEIHHTMLTIHNGVEQISERLQETLSDFDKYLVKNDV